MKLMRIVLMLSLALSTLVVPQKARAGGDWGRYQEPVSEWSIPKGIRTEADVIRYQEYRKTFFFIAAASLLTAVILEKNHQGIRSQARGINIAPGPMQTRVLPGGGVEGFFAIDQNAAADQRRLFRKSEPYRQGAALLGLVSAISFTVALSLRF